MLWRVSALELAGMFHVEHCAANTGAGPRDKPDSGGNADAITSH
jgi:hypothetical protein